MRLPSRERTYYEESKLEFKINSIPRLDHERFETIYDLCVVAGREELREGREERLHGILGVHSQGDQGIREKVQKVGQLLIYLIQRLINF